MYSKSAVLLPATTLKRILSPKSRRQNQLRRPLSAPICSRRQTRHTPRRAISHQGVDLATQRSNIQVVVRVRPSNSSESVTTSRNVVEVIDERMLLFDPEVPGKDFYFHGRKQQSNGCIRRNRDTKYVFDRVYPVSSSNLEIFESSIKSRLDSLLDGFNCSVFAYGATGSGKTYTMLGAGEMNPGLTFLTLMHLYQKMEDRQLDFETSIRVSYLEIYNETVRDLLNVAGKDRILNILEDDNGVSIPHITTLEPQDQQELIQLLADGNSRRTQHPTDHNAESSRSHAVFQVHLSMRAKYVDMNKNVRSAKLVMVDLAGSERGSATGCSGDRFREGASINKSLLALGNCINALADGKKFVPYRDSKLTRLLKDSLGGNCKTIIIANVSPSSLSYEDTSNTLKYANRAKNIRVNVKRNELTVNARLVEYSKVVQEMQEKINVLTGELDFYKNSCKFLSSPSFSQKEIKSHESEDLTDTDEEKENIDEPIDVTDGKVNTFRSLKRHYAETKSILTGTENKIQLKKARLNALDGIMEGRTFKGAERLERQLNVMQEVRNKCIHRNQNAQEEVDTFIQNENELGQKVPIPLSEVLRVKGLEVALETLEADHDKEKHYLIQENQKIENMLAKSMSLLANVHQLSKFHNHTTKQQDVEFETLHHQYTGVSKVRWADQELSGPPVEYTTPLVSCLNTTYTAALN